MKSFAICASLAVFGLTQAQTVFYGGDPDQRNGLVSGYNLASGFEAKSYDNFNIGDGVVTGIFGDWFVSSGYATSAFTTANYEIRTGITDANNGGTLVASGTTSVTAVNTHFGTEIKIYRISSGVLAIPLTAGQYWVTLAPKGDGVGSIFLTTTSGANGVGTPLGDGNSYFSNVSFTGAPLGWSRTDNAHVLGTGTWDFSYGINAVVPEPTSLFVIGIGVAFTGPRQRRVRRSGGAATRA